MPLPDFSTVNEAQVIAPIRLKPLPHTALVDFQQDEVEWRFSHRGVDLRYVIAGFSAHHQQLTYAGGRLLRVASFEIDWLGVERPSKRQLVLAPLTAPLAAEVLDKNVVTAASHLKALFPNAPPGDAFAMEARGALNYALRRGFNADRFLWRLAMLYTAALWADQLEMPLTANGSDLPAPTGIQTAQTFSLLLANNNANVVAIRHEGVDAELAEALSILCLAASPSMSLSTDVPLPSVLTQPPPLGEVLVAYLGGNLRTVPNVGALTATRVWAVAAMWAAQHGLLSDLHDMVTQVASLLYSTKEAPIVMDPHVSMRLAAADMVGCILTPLTQSYVAATSAELSEPFQQPKKMLVRLAAASHALSIGYTQWVSEFGVAAMQLPGATKLLQAWGQENSVNQRYHPGILNAQGIAKAFGLVGDVGEVIASLRPSHAASNRVTQWFSRAKHLPRRDDSLPWSGKLYYGGHLHWRLHPYKPVRQPYAGVWYAPGDIEQRVGPTQLLLGIDNALTDGVEFGLQAYSPLEGSAAIKKQRFTTLDDGRLSEWHLFDAWEHKAVEYRVVLRIKDSFSVVQLEATAELMDAYNWYWGDVHDVRPEIGTGPLITPPLGDWGAAALLGGSGQGRTGGFGGGPPSSRSPSPPPSSPSGSEPPSPRSHSVEDYSADVGGLEITATDGTPGVGTVFNPISDPPPLPESVAEKAKDAPSITGFTPSPTQLAMLFEATGENPQVGDLLDAVRKCIQNTAAGTTNAADFGGENAATRAHDALMKLGVYDTLKAVKPTNRTGVAAALSSVCKAMITRAHSKEAVKKWADQSVRWANAAQALRRCSALTAEEVAEIKTTVMETRQNKAGDKYTASVQKPLFSAEQVQAMRERYSPARVVALLKAGRPFGGLLDAAALGKADSLAASKAGDPEPLPQLDWEVLQEIAIAASEDPIMAQELETYLIGQPEDVIKQAKIIAGLLPYEPPAEEHPSKMVTAEDTDAHVTSQGLTVEQVRAQLEQQRPQSDSSSAPLFTELQSDFGDGGGSTRGGQPSAAESSLSDTAAETSSVSTSEVDRISNLIMTTAKDVKDHQPDLSHLESLEGFTDKEVANGRAQRSIPTANGGLRSVTVMVGKWDKKKHLGRFHPQTRQPLTHKERALVNNYLNQTELPKGRRDPQVFKDVAPLVTPVPEHIMTTRLAAAPQMLMTRPQARREVARELAKSQKKH